MEWFLNALPANITSIDSFFTFQNKLDAFLKLFPDNPPIKGYYHLNSNSLLDYNSSNILWLCVDTLSLYICFATLNFLILLLFLCCSCKYTAMKENTVNCFSIKFYKHSKLNYLNYYRNTMFYLKVSYLN